MGNTANYPDEKPPGYDLINFTIRDMTECGRFLRMAGGGANSMEEAAGRVVTYLYDNLIDGLTGERGCALVRCFKTQDYSQLGLELQSIARSMLGGSDPPADMKCLTLLATVGEKAEWTDRRMSKGHQAIPLPSEEAVHQIPMIRNLIKQLGLDISMVVKPDPKLLMDMEQRTYNVFYVPEALGSLHIPAQEEFVIPHGIRSVLGFGGILPSGDIFTIIMFLKVGITQDVATHFKTLSLNVKMALLPFDQTVFS
ncbi:MAG: hypothetical protein A2X80_09785 [Geobacteraceae bacterium GWB2_52_12]|nr:MAG: hypothetical protein A2X80_09785 [Geobacteraceae bacterium GWB2_52_12]